MLYGRKNVEVNETLRFLDNQKIKLSAVIRQREDKRINQYFLMYVTGSRRDTFIKDITKATVNFKIIEDSRLPESYYQRVAVVNTLATGYEKNSSNIYINELRMVTDREPILIHNENLYQAFSSTIPVGDPYKKGVS